MKENSINHHGILLLCHSALEGFRCFSKLRDRYKIVTASTDEECCELAESLLPELIFIYDDLDRNNGIELCKSIKYNEITKDIPVIFISKTFNPETASKAYEAGAWDYMTNAGKSDEFTSKILFLLKAKCFTNKLLQENIYLKSEIAYERKLISIGAHDLKNPLKVIHGFSKLIEGRYANFTQNDIFEFVRDIKESSEVMIQILSDVIDIINYENDDIPISLEELSLVQLLNIVIYNYSELSYTKNIQINFVEPEENYIVISDFAKLRQIFENLISNALKFSSFNKNVTIKLEKVSDNIENISYRVTISDEGPGIKPEEMEHIFEAFTQLSNTPTGNEYSTRLGMAIVKRLLEILNIDIDIRSTVGTGTTFTLTIPHSTDVKLNPAKVKEFV